MRWSDTGTDVHLTHQTSEPKDELTQRQCFRFIIWWMVVSTFAYGHELWFVTGRMKLLNHLWDRADTHRVQSTWCSIESQETSRGSPDIWSGCLMGLSLCWFPWRIQLVRDPGESQNLQSGNRDSPQDPWEGVWKRCRGWEHQDQSLLQVKVQDEEKQLIFRRIWPFTVKGNKNQYQ